MDPLVEIGSWLDDACKQHQLPDPFFVVSSSLDYNNANSALYLRVVCSRLKSLGYLVQNEVPADTVSPAITLAIKRFQQEAGFSAEEVDGWVGPETLLRLQQLV
ncbi:MAG: peptidoglycan-binding domain-containing protein, partial [Fibrobacterota bacterium]